MAAFLTGKLAREKHGRFGKAWLGKRGGNLRQRRKILKYLLYVVKQIFVFCKFRRNAMFVSKCLGMFFGVKLFA